MSSGSMDLLLWVRGPGFVLALAVFLFGIVLRLFEIFSLGRGKDLSKAREPAGGSGLRTIFTRSLASGQMVRSSPVTYIGGYLFHLGLFATLLLSVSHIELFHGLLGIRWPGLPSTAIDAITVLTIIALLVVLMNRLMDPVKRFLSNAEDYLTWALTLLPLVTGYMAYHHLSLPYTMMLALHILSAEVLLVAIPFTKLAHAITLFAARWYNGEAFGRKGVAS